MISAFQNCSKFEDRTYFGKSHYPKENINMLSHSVSDKVLQNKKWTTLTTGNNKHFIHLPRDNIEFQNLSWWSLDGNNDEPLHTEALLPPFGLFGIVAVMAEEIEEEYLRENWVGPKRKFAHLETIIMDNFRQFIINTWY